MLCPKLQPLKYLACLSQLVGLNLGIPCEWHGGITHCCGRGHGGDTQVSLWPHHFAFPNPSVSFHSCLKAPPLCRCCTATGTAGNGIVVPTHPNTHPPIPTLTHPSQHPWARLCPCPAAPGKERALSTPSFPVGLYFSFHHLLTLDVEITSRELRKFSASSFLPADIKRGLWAPSQITSRPVLILSAEET